MPRPQVAIVSPWPEVDLFVRALGSAEIEADDLTAHAVVDRRGKKLFSKELLDRLNPRELKLIRSGVERVLFTEFPCLGLTDLRPWRRVLSEGARHVENQVVTYALGNSVDHGFGGAVSERPDRYFGVPLIQLIDCHWMAFWEARKAIVEKYAPKSPVTAP
jgi:hypothetical protein